MSARTVETGFFGALGVSNPVATLSDINRGRSVNFKKTNAEKSKTYPLLPIPAGMCITEIAVKQTGSVGTAVTLTFGLQSDSSVSVGGDFALTASGDMLESCQAAATGGLFVKDADMLCIVVPETADITEGSMDVYIRGFMTFGDSYATAPADTEAYRAKLQTVDNVSGGQVDPREYEGPTA